MPELEARLADGETVNREASWAAAIQHAPRLTVADNLRRHFGLLSGIDPDAAWIEAEANPDRSAASIGIELELWWSHILPDYLAEVLTGGQWHGLSDSEKRAFNEVAEPIGFPHRDRCRETVRLGVPSRGEDGLWEFSHRPAWHHQTLVEEVRQLVAAGLVPEGKPIPMHITLGGVEADTKVQFLLRTLEIAGNSSEHRLKAVTSDTGWGRRGTAGVARRSNWKLELGHTKGVELRSLEFHGLHQLERLLGWAQSWGSILVSINEFGDSEAAARWESFARNVETLTGMDVEASSWIDPMLDRRQWDAHVQLLNNPAIAPALTRLLDRFVL